MPTPAEVRELLQPVLEPPTVDFNLPRSILGWLSLVFGLILMVGLSFIVLTATITETGDEGVGEVGKAANYVIAAGIIYVVGLLFAYSFPTSMKLTLENLQEKIGEGNEQARCSDGPEQHQRTSGGDGWILPPPQISEWDTTSPHSADEAGLIQEHPRNIGTPMPPMLTATSLIRAVQSFVAGLLILLAVNLDKGMLPVAGGGIALGIIILLFEYFSRRKNMRITDLATSTMQGLPMGGVEVFGQLRPNSPGSWPAPVYVDGARDKVVNGQVQWYWEYGHKFEWEEYVESTDSEGNKSGEWKDRSSYDRIRNDQGKSDAMVHDGTGGVSVEPALLAHGTLPSTGDWTNRDDSLWASKGRMFATGKIRNRKAFHQWKSQGYCVGDPFFSHCFVRPKTNEEAENVDKTIAHSLAMLTAEGDEPGHKVMTHRGSELLALSDAKSAASAYLPGFLLALMCAISYII
ncbi:MAG: hypothetical protein ISP83_04940 [Candidatus Poseidonia sp.]|nr:hypothetical protein [Poseidonia sp.]MBL6747693.1 hypothetical protein [Poseidonia sp.]MBL6806792.1 hypothetical protein [Poseidonia sp.]